MLYLNLFYIYSIFGHLLEKILNPEHQSGILYGFWTPIYGIGCIFIIYLSKIINNKISKNKFIEILITFITGAMLLSLIEYIGGFLIEKIFNFSFWDYTKKEYNIGKYTSLEMSLIWGISSVILIFIINPYIEKIAKKLPKFFHVTLSILFVFDIFLVILQKL